MDANFFYDLMMDVRQGEKAPLAFVAAIIYLVRGATSSELLGIRRGQRGAGKAASLVAGIGADACWHRGINSSPNL